MASAIVKSLDQHCVTLDFSGSARFVAATPKERTEA
jgi:hypothetical protein